MTIDNPYFIPSLYHPEIEGQTIIIRVSEYFDYQCVHKFRQAYVECELEAEGYVVDMSLTKYIDSCALGLLISMSKFMKRQKKSLKIVNCNAHVKKIFTLVHFDRKLAIE